MAAKTIGQLIIQMGMDLAQMRTDSAEAKKIGRETASEIHDAFEGVKTVLEFVGVAASLGEVKSKFMEIEESMRAVGEASKTLGISTADFQGYGMAFKQAGVDTDQYQQAMARLDRTLGQAMGGNQKAIDTFNAIGVNFREASKGGTDLTGLLDAIADRFAQTADDGNKAANAADLFGRAWRIVVPLLDEGSAHLHETNDALKAMGGEYTEEAIRKAKEFNDQLTFIEAQAKVTASILMGPLMEALTGIMQRFNEAKIAGANFRASLTFGLLSPDNMNTDWIKQQIALYEKAGSTAKEDIAILALLKATLAQKETGDPHFDIGGTWGDSADVEKGKKKKGSQSTTAEQEKDRAAQQSIDALIASMQKKLDVQDQDIEAQVNDMILGKDLSRATAEQIDQIYDLRDALIAAMHARKDEAEAEHDAAAIRGAHNFAQQELDKQARAGQSGLSKEDQERLKLADQIDEKYKAAMEKIKDPAGQANARKQWDADKAAILSGYDEMIAKQRTWASGWNNAFAEFASNATDDSQAAKKVFDDFTTGSTDALLTFVRTGKLDFSSLANSIINDLLRIQIEKSIVGIFGSLGFGAVGGGAKTVAPTSAGTPSISGMAAIGGQIQQGGTYIVGEKGPELFTSSTGGTMTPNDQLGAKIGGGPQIISQPIIHIDARSDQAQVHAIVTNAVQQSHRQIYESMKRKGVFAYR